MTVPAYLSGKAAEEVVEELPGVEEERIETHEDAGLLAAITSWALGVLALAGLLAVRPPKVLPRWLVASALLLSRRRRADGPGGHPRWRDPPSGDPEGVRSASVVTPPAPTLPPSNDPARGDAEG